MKAVCLKVWNVSYGPRCVEVAAPTSGEALQLAISHLGYVEGENRLRVTKVDRTIIVEVQE
jgi:hypothetical protein